MYTLLNIRYYLLVVIKLLNNTSCVKYLIILSWLFFFIKKKVCSKYRRTHFDVIPLFYQFFFIIFTDFFQSYTYYTYLTTREMCEMWKSLSSKYVFVTVLQYAHHTGHKLGKGSVWVEIDNRGDVTSFIQP